MPNLKIFFTDTLADYFIVILADYLITLLNGFNLSLISLMGNLSYLDFVCLIRHLRQA